MFFLCFETEEKMESWSYVSDGGKGMVSGTAAESPSGSISRTGFENWVSNQHPQAMGPSFDELGVPQLIRPPNPVTAFSEASNSSSLIDLKLGRFGDLKDHGLLVGPAKRARAVMCSVAAAYCQVYGCNKDLSSSKDYHKRHKVCEVHSKTATVFVNGIQQRFCQQCSRFHLLVEFDDGKRSCRKRLAGHNERRRKPQTGAHSGKSRKLPQQFNENRLSGSILAPASFICQDILPSSGGGLLNSEVKVENRADYGPFSAIPIPNGQTLPKPPIPPYTFDKHFPFFHDASSSLGGPEDFSAFSTGISDPGCALSLLSSLSQNSSTHSSGFPVAQTLIGMAEPTAHQSGPAQDGPTISMSQLPSQLQRVESQRQSVQTKQGRGSFYCRRIA